MQRYEEAENSINLNYIQYYFVRYHFLKIGRPVDLERA